MVFEGIDIQSNQYTRVEVSGGVIATVERQAQPPGDAPYLSRGFIDIQVNGYQGHDYSSPDLNTDDIHAIVKDLARSGTLRHLPTIITGSPDTMRRNIKVIADAVKADPQLALSIPGIHLEGPYISPLDGARGAHSLRHVRKADVRELDTWQEAAQGLIRMITLAPETEGAAEYIRAATGMGIKVAIGHSLAAADDIDRAVQAGATLSTHLGNGSPGMLPRLNNHIWTQLADDRLMASLIADGFHVPPTTLKVFARAKELNRVILVSDVGTMGGLQPGRYAWGDTLVEVHPDGHLGVADTEYLAGAGHLLNHCIPLFRNATGHTLAEVLHLVTVQPAHYVGIAGYAQGFSVGDPADIVSFRDEGNLLRVEAAALGAETYTA